MAVSFVVREGTKLSSFLKLKLQLSSTQLKRCLQKGYILVNGTAVPNQSSVVLQPCDVVSTTASNFVIAQQRYATQLLRTVYEGPNLHIWWKPGGMPIRGNSAETVEKALPGCMQEECSYQMVDCVNRVASGPVLVWIQKKTGTKQRMPPHSKLYTFHLLLHGRPPSHLDVKGFESLEILEEQPTTTGIVLTHVRIVLHHAGDGLRGCLARNDCPILGTARTKSTVSGISFACVRFEIQWSVAPTMGDDMGAVASRPGSNIVIDMEVPFKFKAAMEREKRFYAEQQARNRQKDEEQALLRRKFLEKTTGRELPPAEWSVASFCGLSFCVTDSVMAPRTCSEVLVQAARESIGTGATVLDLGTGSGCLLVAALVGADPTVSGMGIDVSGEALAVAKCNVGAHGLSDRVELQKADFANLSCLQPNTFDVILCNPPYLTEGERQRDNVPGPSIALIAEDKGLSCYKLIAQHMSSLLKPNGVIVLEIGGKRKEDEICAIFHDLVHHDTLLCSQGRKRCIVLRSHETARLVARYT